jgi:hypothetical protein
MLRLRVSHLDAFRSWKEDPDAELGWLLQSITGSQPTEAMERGTAFHKALEIAGNGVYDRIEVDGYTFLFDCDIELALPSIRETRRHKDYGGIEVSGKVDCLFGRTISDHKSSAYFDAERYFRKYQWRYYLDIFEADRFVWNVFEMRDAGDMDSPRTWSVVALHTLEQYRYPGMDKDCRNLALELKELLETHAPDIRIPIADEPKPMTDDQYRESLMAVVSGEIIP